MNKTDLVDSLSHRAGISKTEAHRCVDALFGTPEGIIARALQRHDKVQVTGFGTFGARRDQVGTRGPESPSA